MNIPQEIQFQRNDEYHHGDDNNDVGAVVVGQHSRFSSGSGSKKDQVPKLMLPKSSEHRCRGAGGGTGGRTPGSKRDEIPKLMLPKTSEHRCRGLAGKASHKNDKTTKMDTRPAIPRKQSSIYTQQSLSPKSTTSSSKTRDLRCRLSATNDYCFKIKPTTMTTRHTRTASSEDFFVLRDIIPPTAQHSLRKQSKSF